MRQFLTNLKLEFHKSRNLIFVLFVFFMVATLSFFATSHTNQSSAVSLSDFNPGNIISDAVMGNYNSMSVSDIQNFLTSKNPCNNTNYDQYLANSRAYPNVTWHWSGEPYNGHFVCISEERFGEGTSIGSGQTAAEIIYGAAQEYKINPQVLIVLLEKEQGLITDTFPHSGQYRAATGYGCPDTAACDAKYYGLKNQVYNAAWLFRYTLDNGYYAYPEQTKGVYIAYNPSASCGRSEVYIENRATAALYRYTPYQPNAAALAAGSGYGDNCSAYGNRNFYLFFTSWFGSTQATIDTTSILIPDGVYGLMANTDLALTATGNYNNAPTQLKSFNSADAMQQWKFERSDNDTYKITNIATGKVLDLKNNATSSGTSVQIYSSDNSCGQRWKLYRNANDLVIESACAKGMVVGRNGGTQNGSTMQLDIYNQSSSAQTWSLYAGRTLPDGLYTISLNSNRTKSIDISGKFIDGANIQLWGTNHTAAQQWRFTYNQTGYYTIENLSSRKVLDISGMAKSGSNIQLWFSNQTCAQRWQVISTGTDQYALVNACTPGLAIDLSGASLASGSNIQLWQYNATNAQQWHIAPAETPTDGVYTISSELAPQRVVDLSGDGSRDGENVQIWYANATAAQEWKLTRDSTTGLYTISNPKSGKILDASGTLRSGTNVQTWTSNNSCAQKWYLSEAAQGVYTIHTSCDPSYAVDVSGIASIGDNIQLWPYNATAAQRWTLTKE